VPDGLVAVKQVRDPFVHHVEQLPKIDLVAIVIIDATIASLAGYRP